MEQHSVSRLIGAPARHIGFEKAGLLTDAVAKNSYAVAPLDEIEKAHPDTFNLLLQAMDSGMVTSSNGHQADFRTIVIMTTNVGAQDLQRQAVDFHPQNYPQGWVDMTMKLGARSIMARTI